MAQTKVQDVKTGTTTVGVKTADAIVLAADMRASMGHIAYDEESEKIYKITDSLAVTNAGNVGDSLTIVRFLRSQARLYEMEREERLSVRGAATLLSNILNANRYYPFIVQLIIAGVNNEPELFELTPYGGVIERKHFAVSGSGTEFAMNTLDQGFNEGMTEEEGARLAVKAIEAGKKRDIYSGGKSVTVMIIDRNGVRKLSEKEVEKHVCALKNGGKKANAS
ncbi:MAG: proteasome subunit beta [Candidatus Diapherotrites archaeon]|nr:proteasome subunit beta [Candidatus Micrarchaeota archaeon]MBU1939867.1 proteasome subunit beta [Candidatus Micrarchaeota archaeon]